MMARKLRLVPYIRVSKVNGREGDSFGSPGIQLEKCQQKAGLKGYGLLSEIRDLDESGGTLDRPGLREALELVYSGKADGIIVAKLDRFARDPAAITVIEEMERKGKLFLSAVDDFDTSTSVGKFALGMMVLVAKLERDRHIENFDDVTRRAIARGVHTTVPYGYMRSNGKGSKLMPEPAEAPVVQRIYAMRAKGMGAAPIADVLNAEGVKPRRAASWSPQSIRVLIRLRVYVGEASYGRHVQVGAHDPLVTEGEWAVAQFSAPRHVNQAGRGKQVLTGILRCAGCGYAMGGGSSTNGRRYQCGRKHSGGVCPAPTSCNADALEGAVIAAFLDRYGDTAVDGAADSPEVLFTKLEWDRLQREYLAWRDDTLMREALGAEEYRAGLLARKEALDEAAWKHEEAVREMRADTLTIDTGVWPELSTPERRELLRAGIDAVLVSRSGSRHTPVTDRLDIRWIGETATDSFPRRGRLGVVATLDRNP